MSKLPDKVDIANLSVQIPLILPDDFPHKSVPSVLPNVKK